MNAHSRKAYLVMLSRFGKTLVVVVALAAAAGCAARQPVFGLSVPAGFHIALFSSRVPNARFMAFAPNGDLLVAETTPGKVVALRPGVRPGDEPTVVLDGLDLPHGLAFRGDDLYVATWSSVLRLRYPRAPGARQQTLLGDLPQGGDHNRRALAIAGDGTIFVSSGSTCNVCQEPDPRFATVLRLDPGGSHERIYARGLRNASGLAFDADGNLWAVMNGADWLGDNTPADELIKLRAGGDYGWPYCYGADLARHRNPEYLVMGGCPNAIAEDLDFQAHSAPLAIVFYEGAQFPQAYRGAAFVAFHGSWNRSVKTGYKVVVVFFQDGKPRRTADFATGWLSGGDVSGRPAGLAIGPDGSLYVSDDDAGRIYRITYKAPM